MSGAGVLAVTARWAVVKPTLSPKVRLPVRVTALLIAALPLMAATCETGETAPTRVGNPGPALPGRVDSPSCDTAHYRRGVSGRVVGWERVDGGPYDGVRCLEIKTRKGRYILIRVSRKVFDRCIEGDPYPRCARRSGR